MNKIKVFSIFINFVFFVTIFGKSVTYEEIFEKAQNINDLLLETRRWLHQHPELGHQEFETSKYIQDALSEHNITFTANWGYNSDKQIGGTGIVAQIGTGESPCVALRGDMDALPITELVDLPFKSSNEGVMHACGHDAHTTMLLGSALLLKQFEKSLNGTVKFFFQPAEEGGGGGKFMVLEGAMDQHPPVDRVFGQHVTSSHPTGTLYSNGHTLSAGASSFTIEIIGKGGHAASHHLTIDPISCAMEIFRSLYDVYARELYFQPETAGLISVTFIDAGTSATNVIPDSATMGGTIRALKTNTLYKIVQRVIDVAQEIGKAYKCTINIDFPTITYPSLENDPEVFEFFKKTAAVSAPDGQVHTIDSSMGAEDFSFFAQKAPALFYMLGAGSGVDPPTNVGHHNSMYALDESVLPQGSSLFTYLAMKSIEEMNGIHELEEVQVTEHEEL